MKIIHEQNQDHREWEVLDAEKCTHLIFENGLYNLPTDCTITFSRDNQYDIKATISGVAHSKKELEPNEPEIGGTFVSRENIIAYSPDCIFKYKIFGVAISSIKSSPFRFEGKMLISFEANLLLDRIEKKHDNYEYNLGGLTEWFISSRIQLFYPRGTSREIKKRYVRSRNSIDEEVFNSAGGSKGTSNDFFLVKTPEYDFIVGQVEESYGPSWAHKMCIEYRTSFKKVPNEREREAIREFISFILGAHLLKIGESVYDTSNNLVSQMYMHPWGSNVVSKCSGSALSPVAISRHTDWGQIEIIANSLIPQYLNLRSKLGLKGTIWKFWLAKDSPVGTNLPILSSALENLADKILKDHPEKKHYYISYKDFNDLIKDELDSIKSKIASNSNHERILNRIRKAAERGGNEKLDMMFEILELPIGDLECKAIKARNSMAHSSIDDITDEEAINAVRITRAYETLFNRVLLKLLGHKGTYIDYYTEKHPTRPIDEYIPS